MPRVEGDRLIGRGAYDMKGALAAMMCAVRTPRAGWRPRALRLRARRGVRGRRRPRTDDLVADGLHGRLRDHRRAHRPAHRRPGEGRAGAAPRGHGHGGAWLDAVARRQRDAQGASTPSARIETLPFARESSDLFDRPSINLGRIAGGDAFNKVPDRCSMDVDIRYLPGQDPGEILAQIRAIAGRRGRQDLQPRARDRLAHQPVRPARCATPCGALDRGRGAERRPRRRLGRDLVPRGGRPGGRVRPRRRRPPRPRGVGLDRVPGALPPALVDFMHDAAEWLERAWTAPACAQSRAGSRESAWTTSPPRPAAAGSASASLGGVLIVVSAAAASRRPPARGREHHGASSTPRAAAEVRPQRDHAGRGGQAADDPPRSAPTAARADARRRRARTR